MLKVQLFDEDLISDTLIGEANFQVQALVGEDHVIRLYYKGKVAAEINVSGRLIETDNDVEFNKLLKELFDMDENEHAQQL